MQRLAVRVLNGDPVRIECREGTALITLQRSVTNAIHPELLAGLEHALAELAADEAVRSVVLTGGEKFFSIGFDLPYLLTLPETEFAAFYHDFNRLCLKLYRFPRPVIAALRGHATAGGCILALCCDLRLLADGHKLIGLNEVRLGVPVPFPADRIVHALVGGQRARRVLEGGDFHQPAAALELGLVDEVLPAETLPGEAQRRAADLASLPGDAYALIKANRTQPTIHEIEAGLKQHEQQFIRCWFSTSAQPRLFEAATRF